MAPRRRSAAKLGGVGVLAVVVVAGVVWALGGNPMAVLRVGLSAPTGETTDTPSAGPPSANDPDAQFVSVVLADTEDTWGALFPAQLQRPYQPPRLVLFRDLVSSACGEADSAIGPFYCSADRKVYLDLAFFHDLDRRLGAPGDFAQAYVIGHEVGHHIQTLLGTGDRVRQMRRSLPQAESNALSVRFELQADCYSGVWAHHAHRQRQILEPGDVEEALRAAAAIGDDRLQRQSRGRVVPESFTHGTSQERVHWFRRGMTTGLVASCDTL